MELMGGLKLNSLWMHLTVHGQAYASLGSVTNMKMNMELELELELELKLDLN